MQAESLFNDATSLVLFQIAVSFAVAGQRARPAVLLHGAGQFAVLAAGGAAVGGVIAAGVIQFAGGSPIRCWRPCSR